MQKERYDLIAELRRAGVGDSKDLLLRAAKEIEKMDERLMLIGEQFYFTQFKD